MGVQLVSRRPEVPTRACRALSRALVGGTSRGIGRRVACLVALALASVSAAYPARCVAAETSAKHAVVLIVNGANPLNDAINCERE